MADERKAGSLILKQLGMFNEAVKLFGNIVEPAILEAFDKTVESFANENNWHGAFDLEDDNECWLFPPAWNTRNPEEEEEEESGGEYEYKARFEIDSIKDDDDFWTACFCRQAGGEAGFVFSVKLKEFGGARAWNAYAARIDPELIAELNKNGYTDLSKGKFFLPIHLDVGELEAAWEKYGNEDVDSLANECLGPLNIALETLESTWGIFDKIINGFSQKAGKS